MAGRADPHVHTTYSGFSFYHRIEYPESMTTPERAVDAAVARGLDVLCITDHNTIRGALRARDIARKEGKVEVVIGEEITTCDGELVGLFLSEEVPAHTSAAEAVEKIHAQGGLAVAVHPYSFYCPSLGEKAGKLPLDGMEVLNAAHGDGYVNRLAQERIPEGVAALGGSDAHSALMIGNAYTNFEGKSAEEFYKAVKGCGTMAGGRTSTTSEYVRWTTEIATGVFRRVLAPRRGHPDPSGAGGPGTLADDPHSRIDRIRRRSRALIAFSCILFLSSPLPFVVGAIGRRQINDRGLDAWKSHKGRAQSKP